MHSLIWHAPSLLWHEPSLIWHDPSLIWHNSLIWARLEPRQLERGRHRLPHVGARQLLPLGRQPRHLRPQPLDGHVLVRLERGSRAARRR
eukprot:3003486-Prymnesium_polylepis.1